MEGDEIEKRTANVQVYSFRDFRMVEWRDGLGGLALYSASTLPERYKAMEAFRMNPIHFVDACEDLDIRAYVRSDPTISKETKAFLSGFGGKLDTSNTAQGKKTYCRFCALRLEAEREED
jgi:hypothetical protein